MTYFLQSITFITLHVSRTTSVKRENSNAEFLLQKNHSQHALLLHKVLHNHLPHLLGSVYFLSGTTQKLKVAYDHESKELESWQTAAPEEITSQQDFQSHLGDILYQRAYFDYFTKKLAGFEYDWKTMVSDNLLQGPHPLIDGLVGGFGHPLILLADAYEMNSSDLAVEALALNAIDYNALHQVLEIPNPEPTGPFLTPQDIIHGIYNDRIFDGLLSAPGVQNTTTIMSNPQSSAAVIHYLRALDVSNLPRIVAQLADLAALLECAVHKPGEPAFDFYLNHILTLTYSLRVLLPVFPAEKGLLLVRGVWLLTIVAYISQLRPMVKPELIDDVDLSGVTSWEDIFKGFHEGNGLQGKWLDAHLIRGMRNLMEFGKMRKEKEAFYMKAAVKLEAEWKFCKE
ncbi:hypothetical protein N431DRAFT_503931 [Stipitochalara longipes BDJ]|nr:hypothetical protein N431DRAFT_503931 [Stipitochalara longipes BDJ]